MAKLYPPITEEVMPAFCLTYNKKEQKISASIRVDFNLNRAVANAEIQGIAMRLRTISTNKYVITEDLNINPTTGKSEGIAIACDVVEGKANFLITMENNPDAMELLKVGQYYKIQLAFIGLDNGPDIKSNIGYWSSVATIKCVAKPSVTIANFDQNDVNIFTNEIVGKYEQDTSTGDSSEKVYSYSFELYDDDGNIIDETGQQLHNSTADTSSTSSTDIFRSYKELTENKFYYIIYKIKTINGLEVQSPRYQVIAQKSIDPEEDITLVVSNGTEDNYYEARVNQSWHPWEEGIIKIYPDLNGHVNHNINDKGANKTITGNFVILRSSSKDNYQTWQEVRRFRLQNQAPYTKVIYDYTVEQGISYRYAIQQFNRQQFYSKKIYAYKRNPINGEILYENSSPVYNDVMADFEDMFLYDGKRQLKIKFNPKVASFKNSLQEQKIDTIGGKHPFIFRNGIICYKEFPISGLISFQEDEAELFINNDDYEQMMLERFELDSKVRDKDSYYQYKLLSNDAEFNNAIKNNTELYRQVLRAKDQNPHENLLTTSQKSPKEYYYEKINTAADAIEYRKIGYPIYKKQENVLSVTGERYFKDYQKVQTYSKTDLTSENIAAERYFKLLVLDWLTDGKPKLFRSPTEGNYIVRLLNVSLTPKTELGRMIHEFSCTAYEIADFNYQSLKDLGLLTVEEINEHEVQWYSRNIKDILKSEETNGWYRLDLEDKEVLGFTITGCYPGDKINIITSDSPLPIQIDIGVTGVYTYDLGRPVVGISILPVTDIGDFSRTITLNTQGYTYQKFDTIASIAMHTQIGEQLVGPVPAFLGKTTVGSGAYYASPNLNLIANDGEKLRVSEILHLHAKRREVIPIFYNKRTAISGSVSNLPMFSLTPFGQGYIRSKSIVPKSDIEWATGLGNLTEAELREERNIQELVDFVISKCNKDIFCLFEVYVPDGNPRDKATKWMPYRSKNWAEGSSDWGAQIHGIFDPWLYQWQSQQLSDEKQQMCQHLMGWWPLFKKLSISTNTQGIITVPAPADPKTYYNFYDPTIKFVYNNTTTEISLKEKPEISVKNINVPESIRIGNGVIMEPIYRIQYIDYTIENENSELKALKNQYLTKKATAQKKVQKYQKEKYTKTMGEILFNNYSTKLYEIQDYENYVSIIGELTDEAKIKQESLLKTFFTKEKQLVETLISQLANLDADSAEKLGMLYEKNSSQRIYGSDSTLYNAKSKYDDYLKDKDRFPKQNLVPSLYDKDSTKTAKESETRITQLINHIARWSGHNFPTILANLSNSYNSNLNNTNQLFNELGNKIYVGQFLQLLEDKVDELLFTPIKTAPYSFDLTKLKGTYNGIDLSNKNPLAYSFIVRKATEGGKKIRGVDLLSNQWEAYFHLTDETQLATLSTSFDKFKLTDLDQYTDSTEPHYIYSGSFLLNAAYPNNGLDLINKIKKSYNAVKNFNNTKTRDEQIADYNKNYGEKHLYSSGDPNITALSLKQYQLGVVQSDNTIISAPYMLENMINNLYLEDPDISVDDIIKTISKRSIIYLLPETATVKLQTKIKNYIKDYITSGARAVYLDICACDAYKTEHKDELTQEQQNVVISTIKKLKKTTEYANFINKNEYQWDLKTQTPTTITSFGDIFTKWQNDYNNIGSSDDIASKKREFTNYVEDFNSIINYYNSLLAEFKNIRLRYEDLKKNYKTSDNIREILWTEIETYSDIQNQLNYINEVFKIQLQEIKKDVLFDGYIKFLTSYKEYKSNGAITIDKQKWVQLVEEASIMASTSIDETNSPYNQHLIVQKAWKKYLDALAKVYQVEVKERFG